MRQLRLRRCVVYVVFFFSGAAALTYEISWARQIGLLLGNTASAAATVLASYFVGLALGYAVAARLAERTRRPLVAYGVLELTAAAWALSVPLVLSWLEAGRLASLSYTFTPLWRNALRAAICLVLFLPATTALGGTLPLMARWVDYENAAPIGRIAWAYGLNTFGGLVGVLVATIVLLSQVGVVASSYVAAAVSAACGVIAITFALIAASGQRQVPESAVTSPRGRAPRNGPAISVLVGISGFVTLGLEVLYTRLFALTFHNSTYTFGLVVAVVLMALSMGAWLAAWAQHRWNARQAAGWAFLLGGAATAVSILLFVDQSGLGYFHGGNSFAAYMAASGGLVAFIVLPPALLLGAVLPLLWSAACSRGLQARANDMDSAFEDVADWKPHPTSAAVVGRLTAVNTLSAAGGALAASFVTLPWLGLWTSFAALAATCLLGSALLLGSRRAPMFWLSLVVAACVVLAAWRTTVFQQAVPEGKTLVRRTEGAYGWIDVLRDNSTGELSLRENVNYTHGSTASGRWERRQSHIPLLLHRQPRDVLYLGCGTGATAGGATMHESVQAITIAELIPEVIDAARLFDASNLGVIDDPRTKIHLDDARHYLLATERRFDVIVSDLFVPWESKTGYLYTVDHYEIARERLKPDGIFCQWLALWQLGEGEFEMIADSFASVFPNATLWWGKVEYDRSIIGIVGSERALSIDADDLGDRLRSIYRHGPEDARLNRPGELARRYIGRWHVRENAVLNTDEHPRLEFAMPLTYANRETLKRRRLQMYDRDALATLPQTGLRVANFYEAATRQQRRDWQQLQLRK